MTSRRYSMLFTFGLFALAAWAVWEASHWAIQAGLMAWIIGVPTVLLLGLELVRELMDRGTPVGSDRPIDSPMPLTAPPLETDECLDPVEERRRTAIIICWIVGFGGAIWLLGFHTGITLLTFLYLRFTGGESWSMTVGLTAAVWLVTTFFFDCTMHIFFAEGKLFTWTGVSSSEFYTSTCQVFSGLFR